MRAHWGGIAGPEVCTRVGFRSPPPGMASSSHTAMWAGARRPEGFLRVFSTSCMCVSRRPKEECQQNHQCSRQAVGGSVLCRPTGEEFQEGHSLLQEPEGPEGRRPRSPRVTRCLSVTQPFGASPVTGVGELHGSSERAGCPDILSLAHSDLGALGWGWRFAL